MYGTVVGKATQTIKAGGVIGTHNLKHKAAPYSGRTKTYQWAAFGGSMAGALLSLALTSVSMIATALPTFTTSPTLAKTSFNTPAWVEGTSVSTFSSYFQHRFILLDFVTRLF